MSESVEKQKQEIMNRRKNAKIKGTLYLILSEISLLIVFSFLQYSLLLALFFSSVITMTVVFFLVIYFILSPEKVIGYRVPQNRCLLIEEADAYKRSSPQSKDREIGEGGWLVPREGDYPKKCCFGLYDKIAPGIGLSKIEIHRVRFFEWGGFFEYAPMLVVRRDKFVPGEHSRIESKEDIAWDGWLIAPYPYGYRVFNEYTMDNVAISFNVGIYAHSDNPSLTHYETEDWWKVFIGDIGGRIVNKVRTSSYKGKGGIREFEGNLASFFAEDLQKKDIPDVDDKGNLKINPDGSPKLVSILDKVREYGMTVSRLQIAGFSAPKDVVEASEALVKQEYQKEAARVEAEKNRNMASSEIGAVLDLFLSRACMSLDDYAKEMEDPQEFTKKFGDLWEGCRKDVMDWIAMRNGAAVRLHSDGDVGLIGKGGAIYKKLDQLPQKNHSPIDITDSSVERGGTPYRGKIFDEKTANELKKAGIPVDLQNEV